MYDIYLFRYTTLLNSTSPPKSFRSVMAASVTAMVLMIFSEALSISPRALTNVVNFVLKGISRIVNFDNWQWVWKHLIIHIRLFKNKLCCNTLSTMCFSISHPVRSNKSQTINPVHIAMLAIQKESSCKLVYPGSSYYSPNLPFICHKMKYGHAYCWQLVAVFATKTSPKIHFR